MVGGFSEPTKGLFSRGQNQGMEFILIVIAVALGIALVPFILGLFVALGGVILVAALAFAFVIIVNTRPEWIMNAGAVALVGALLVGGWFAIPWLKRVKIKGSIDVKSILSSLAGWSFLLFAGLIIVGIIVSIIEAL